MPIDRGLDMLRALCDALGVDWRTRRITGITLTLNVDELARVEVREYAEVPEGEKVNPFEKVVKQFTLCPEFKTYEEFDRFYGLPTDAERLAAEDSAIAAALTLNEARAAVGLPPVPGGDDLPNPYPHRAVSPKVNSAEYLTATPREMDFAEFRRQVTKYTESLRGTPANLPEPGDADAPHVVEDKS